MATRGGTAHSSAESTVLVMGKAFQCLLLLILVSCNSTPSLVNVEVAPAPAVPAVRVSAEVAASVTATDYTLNDRADSYEGEAATFYIVIADTSGSYNMLREKMLLLHNYSKIPIDTMGRTYIISKDLIALPYDDQDEMYAGDYYPRRFPSKALSLEYLSLYQEKAGEKTIALVAGIYERHYSADSAMSTLSQSEKAFVVKSDMYIGCIH